MVVTFAAGGSSDVLARSVANAMSRGLGRQVVVENRPGAGGNIGAIGGACGIRRLHRAVRHQWHARPSGPRSTRTCNTIPCTILAPVGMLHQLPNVLIVNPSVPATSLRELIDYARDNPGKLTFASAGVGSASHLAGELLKAAANIDMLHVPYKGGGAAIAGSAVGPRVDDDRDHPQRPAGGAQRKMRALGVTTPRDRSAAPDIADLGRIRACRTSTSAPGPVCSCPPARRARSSSA